jgi:hypothetical protein
MVAQINFQILQLFSMPFKKGGGIGLPTYDQL